MEKTENNLNIKIQAGTIIKIIVILTLTFLLYKMLDLVLVVLTSVVLASAIEPVIKWFKKYKINRLFSVIITYGLVILFSIGIFYFFIPPVLDEASNLLNNAPKYLDSLPLWNPLSEDRILKTTDFASDLSEGINGTKGFLNNFSGPSALGDLINKFKDLTANTSDGLINIASGIFGGILSFILIIVLSFYLAVQEGGVEKFLKLITPIKNEYYIIDLWKRSQRKIGYWMQGQLLLAIMIGVLVYLGLTILGVPNAMLLAVLAGILEIIPLFGPVIAAIPAILFGFIEGGWTLSVLVLGLFIIIQQFENNLIYPLVVKKVVGVPPIIVILSLIIGAKLAGFLGILLSVPITSAFLEFIDDIQKDKNLEEIKFKEQSN